MKDNKKTTRALLRQKAEELLILQKNKAGDVSPTEADILKLIHELQVHQIELEMQNEELTLANQQEELAKEKYASLFDFAPLAYFTLSASGNIAELNLTGANMLGKERPSLVNNMLSDFILPDYKNIYADFLSKTIIGKSPHGCEVAFDVAGALPRYSHLSGTMSDDGIHCLITVVDITDRKNIEQQLRNEAERNSLLLELFATAPALTDDELFSQALDIAVKITDSTIGFFHQVSDNQQEIILTTWNDEAKKNCRTAYDNHYSIEKAGNWADCVRQKKVLVFNDYPVSPNKKGLPEGHSPIGRMLCIPVVHEEKVRLIFGVGNKSSDYTDSDVIQIQAIANEMHKILEKRKVERDLQKSEDRWQFAIEGSNDGIWDWNVQTDEVFFSGRWKEMIGLESDELEGKLSEWQNRVHPDDIEDVLLKLQQHFEKKTPDYASEHRILCRDGSSKWILDRGKVLQWTSEGKPFRMVGTHTDITKRKNIEEDIRKSEEKFRIVADNAFNWEFWEGSDGRWIHHSPSCKKITGYLADEFLSDNDFLLKIIHPDDRQAYIDHHHESITHQTHGKHFFRIITKEGEIRNIEHVCQAVFDDANSFIGIRGSNIDITERKLAENRLKESEVQYRNLANAGSALIWTSGTDKLCNYFNEIWLKFTGRTLDQELGNGWVEGVHPEDSDRCLDTYLSAFEKQLPFKMEYRLLHSSGEYRWIVDLGTPNFTSTGKFVGYIGHCFDISERKLIEDTQAFLLGCGLPGTGDDFFESLARYMAETLNMEYVCIDRLEGDGLMAQSVAIYNEGRIESNVLYALKDTPCGEVVDRSVCLYQRGVRHLFPKNKALQDLHAESYIGSSLLSSKGETIGLIAIIGHKPLPEAEKAETLLKLVSPRVAGELERRVAENTLKETLEQLNQVKQDLEKRVEERTREIQEISGLQKTILDNVPLAIMTTDVEGIFQSINPAGEKMLGYTANEIIGKLSPLFFHDKDELVKFCIENTAIANPTDQEMYGIAFQYMFHKTTEWTWTRKNGEKFPVRLTHNSINDDTGTLQGYMGLLIDITQEKLAIDSLRESEERFHSMFHDHAAIMLLINPENGEIIEANKAAEKFYGLSFNKIPKLLISGINIFSPDAIQQEMEGALSQHRNYFVFPHKLASGEIRTVEVHATPIEVRGKKVLFSIIHDITERKLAENALKDSEAENRAIIQAVPDLMFRINRDGTYLDSHSQNESALFVPSALFVGKKVNEVLPPDLARQSMQAIEKAFTTGEIEQYEYMLAINDNDRYFENRTIAISDKEVLAIIRDITDKKIAETELQKALQKLSTLIQNLRAGTLFENETRHITLVNQSFCNLFNIPASPDQMVGFDCEVASEESKHLMKDPEGFLLKITDILSKGEIVVNDELYLLDGRVLERDYIPIKNNDTLLGHLWQYRDITNRKESETALKMQSAAFESFAITIIITDITGRIQWVNSAFTKLTGYSADEAIGKMAGDLLKSGMQDKEFYKKFWDVILSKKVWSGELINRRKDGTPFYEEETITPVLDARGNISSFIAIKIDITERKKLFQELADEKRRLADIIKGTNAGTWEWNIQTGETILNDQWAEMIGYSLHEISPVSIQTWMKFSHPDDLITSGELLEKHFKGELDYYSFESRMKHKNGEWIWVLDRGRVHMWDSKGNPLRMSGTHQDITERKRASEFDAKLLELSLQLTGIPASEIAPALDMALGRIGDFLGADRAYIFEINPAENTMNNTFEWCNKGITREIENLKDIPCDIFPMWMATLNQQENIVVTSVKDLPENWQAEREILEPQGIQSLVVIPILLENTLIGFVGLDYVTNKKEFKESEINILKVWGNILASLINYQRKESYIELMRQNYETFFNTIDDFLFVLDGQGNMIHTNTTVNRRLGYSSDELMEKSVLMVHPAERRDEAGRIVGEMLADIAEFCPVPLITKSGHYIPVETRVKHGFWDGKPAIFGVSKDVSKIKLSEEKFSKAFQSNSALMAITTFDGRFMDINDAFVKSLGYSRDEIIGNTSNGLNLFDVPGIRNEMAEVLGENIVIREVELMIRKKSGDLITGLFSADLIIIGEEKCLLTMMVDISERKLAESEIIKAKSEAETANLAKSEFLSRMSHELRTPMNSILGFAQLLEMGELNPKQKKGVSHILNNGKHLLDLINEVLDISGIEAGRQMLITEPVQLSGIINEITDSIQVVADKRKVTVEFVDSPANSLFAFVDRLRLKQVLLNLINNAIKYNIEGGTVTINTMLQPAGAPGNNQVRISISDTGIGIKSEDIGKLFQAFERIGADRTGTEGTGLGLMVVKKLTEAMSGKVGVESVAGSGSTFWIELPLSEHLNPVASHIPGSMSPELPANKQGATILYVEDNLSNIELVEEIMVEHRPGISLITSMLGQQTVTLAIKHKPALILLDLDLPDIKGIEVLEQLLADVHTKEIPVIIISADAMPFQIKKLMTAGAADYLSKPLDVVQFLRTLDRHLKK